LRSALAGDPPLYGLTTFDVHQHLLPEALVRALRARAERPRVRRSRLELADGDYQLDLRDHDPGRRLELLDRDGIDVAVLSCPPTLGLSPDLLAAYHEGIADVVASSNGRFVALSSDAALDGFAGLCVAGRSLLDLEAIAPLLDEVERRGGLLFVHPGLAVTPPSAPAWWSPVVTYTAEMQAAFYVWLAAGAARWPELVAVFAILAGGAAFQLERLAARGGAVALPRNVYLETASYGGRALALSLEAIGPSQLVYGSDLPVIDSRPTLEAVRRLGATVADAVCRDNPARIVAAMSRRLPTSS
jgi:predicted TIM-barrel fold metal-dependent hydrolase